jgi:RNA dependent RNA polymerase
VFKSLLEKDLKKSLGVVNDYLDKPIALRDWVADLGGIYKIRCYEVEEYTDSGTGESKSKEPRCIAYNLAGVPTMKEEVCVEMLEAGFLPKTNRFLREKLKFVLTKACEKISEKMHISISKSTSMICIADDLGVLEENEVSIRFGKPFRDEETGRNRYYIEGDVLVARVTFWPSFF